MDKRLIKRSNKCAVAANDNQRVNCGVLMRFKPVGQRVAVDLQDRIGFSGAALKDTT
jgi:hypothetical protein